MRILYFTSLKGVHGRKWVAHFLREHEVHVATFKASKSDLIAGANIHQIQNLERLPIDDLIVKGVAGKPVQKSSTALSAPQQAWLTFKIGLRYTNRFAKLIDAIKPDVIHAHQSVPFGWYALCATSLARHNAPLLVSAWGTDVLAYPDQSRLYRWMNRQILQKATKVTATSNSLREGARRFAPGRIIDVIPFGVDTKLFVRKTRPRDKASIFGIAKYFEPVYRIDLAIEGLALAQKSNPSLRLELAGSGPEEENLRARAKQLHVEDSVRFLGHISQAEMPKSIANWDAMLILSRQESFGVAALEASAVGIPVIAARVGGLPEVIKENETGKFIDRVDAAGVAKAMLEMAADRRLSTRAFEHGPAFVRANYEWISTAAQMENVYRSLINRRSKL